MKMMILTVFLLLTNHVIAGSYGAEYNPEQASLTSAEKIKNYLLRAAKEGDLKIVSAVIDNRFDLNVADNKGYTSLILAAYHGHNNIVELLLRSGANPCQKDKRGNTALMGAIFKGEISIGRQLIAANCKDEQNNVGQTPAMYAALFQRLEFLALLKESGADFSAKDIFGNSVETLKKGEVKAN